MQKQIYRALFGWLGLVMALSLFTGCGLTEFENTFDTEFTVPKPERSVFGLQPFSKSKRFKFDEDPADAEYAKIKRAGLTVIAPAGSDLSFLNRLEVYLDEEDGQQTLLATAEDFKPGESSRELTVEYDEDMRGFVRDQRVYMTFVVYPSGWSFNWPEDGISVRADVTMKIKADVF
jgi:hypothetical protein